MGSIKLAMNVMSQRRYVNLEIAPKSHSRYATTLTGNVMTMGNSGARRFTANGLSACRLKPDLRPAFLQVYVD